MRLSKNSRFNMREKGGKETTVDYEPNSLYTLYFFGALL